MKDVISMKIRRLLACMLATLLMLTLCVPLAAQAQTSSEPSEAIVTHRWLNVADISLSLRLSNGNVISTGTITGLSGTSYISATYTLEKKGLFGGWSTVNSWSKTANGSSLLSSEAISGTGGTYRLSVSAKVTRNGVVETISASVEKKL